jgi:hypothetical protein
VPQSGRRQDVISEIAITILTDDFRTSISDSFACVHSDLRKSAYGATTKGKTEMTERARGSCLCRGVVFEIDGKLNTVLACHCSQCAKTSGNFAAMTRCADENLRILTDESLTWFSSSENVKRGFCNRCGGNLFWKQDGSRDTYITAGSLDHPTGVKISEHIFVASKSDFYDITDGLPQKDEW